MNNSPNSAAEPRALERRRRTPATSPCSARDSRMALYIRRASAAVFLVDASGVVTRRPWLAVTRSLDRTAKRKEDGEAHSDLRIPERLVRTRRRGRCPSLQLQHEHLGETGPWAA